MLRSLLAGIFVMFLGIGVALADPPMCEDCSGGGCQTIDFLATQHFMCEDGLQSNTAVGRLRYYSATSTPCDSIQLKVSHHQAQSVDIDTIWAAVAWDASKLNLVSWTRANIPGCTNGPTTCSVADLTLGYRVLDCKFEFAPNFANYRCGCLMQQFTNHDLLYVTFQKVTGGESFVYVSGYPEGLYGNPSYYTHASYFNEYQQVCNTYPPTAHEDCGGTVTVY